MIELLIVLAALTILFWIGYHVTGALLAAAIWLFIKLPIAVLLGCFGYLYQRLYRRGLYRLLPDSRIHREEK